MNVKTESKTDKITIDQEWFFVTAEKLTDYFKSHFSANFLTRDELNRLESDFKSILYERREILESELQEKVDENTEGIKGCFEVVEDLIGDIFRSETFSQCPADIDECLREMKEEIEKYTD